MYLKINYFQGSTLGGMFRIFLAGIVFLCIGEADICSGAKIDELNRNSTFHQKFSPGKAIKYYKSIENGTNLVPLSYDRLVFHKQSIKSMEIPFTGSVIKIDGQLDETAWKSGAEVASFELSLWILSLG